LRPRFLLDTHVLVRWLTESRRLSKEQARIMREVTRRHEPVAISAITLLEIAVLSGKRSVPGEPPVDKLLGELESHPVVQIVPLTVEIAAEVAALGRSLRDPADRAIVATARVGGLRFLTSDERIVESNLVPVIA